MSYVCGRCGVKLDAGVWCARCLRCTRDGGHEVMRVKVGDLVCVPFGAASRTGIVTAIPEHEYVCFNVKVDGVKHVYAACDVHPFEHTSRTKRHEW